MALIGKVVYQNSESWKTAFFSAELFLLFVEKTEILYVHSFVQ